MSASVSEADSSSSQIFASAGKTSVKPAEGYGNMRAGALDPVCIPRLIALERPLMFVYNRSQRKSSFEMFLSLSLARINSLSRWLVPVYGSNDLTSYYLTVNG